MGQVGGKVYWQYILSYGVLSFVALIVLWSSEQARRVGRGGVVVWGHDGDVAAIPLPSLLLLASGRRPAPGRPPDDTAAPCPRAPT